MKRIACLHGHFSNISLLADAFASVAIDMVHYVDPGLLLNSEGKNALSYKQSQAKLQEQLNWMQTSAPDAMVITCTQYAACVTDEVEAASALPIFTIDQPFFHEICHRAEPQILLFSNPATVDPTMNRLRDYAHLHGLHPQIEVSIIEGAFTLLLDNKQDAYREAVKNELQKLATAHHHASLAVAQLSMSPVAQQFTAETGIAVSHPLRSLVSQMTEKLGLTKKEHSLTS
ncbi:hypothetical protein BRE01_42430 [Brevibacillus reuszeri]|uniref:Asp/Glu racemase n=1 Tax=Brevibacillus reuszeri TaxID=54915 RepID=A0A0K9YUK8_9BACL|nr:hypothetical protein [Brevibacillus reuszeri]KNB72393.1 hypothetical protein ADS79_10985 [Brevibacillus reuszeri]MED1860944.1 hypothetical protein [Brevibacillus reuszeri]GED70541.1 hypothetical protein BRE01_42430 [Brevibacillus reuszeri]